MKLRFRTGSFLAVVFAHVLDCGGTPSETAQHARDAGATPDGGSSCPVLAGADASVRAATPRAGLTCARVDSPLAGRLLVAEWGHRPSRVVRLPAGGGSAASADVIASGFVGVYGIHVVTGSGVFITDVGGGRVSLAPPDGSLETLLTDVAAPAASWRTTKGELLVVGHVDADRNDAAGYLLRLSGT